MLYRYASGTSLKGCTAMGRVGHAVARGGDADHAPMRAPGGAIYDVVLKHTHWTAGLTFCYEVVLMYYTGMN